MLISSSHSRSFISIDTVIRFILSSTTETILARYLHSLGLSSNLQIRLKCTASLQFRFLICLIFNFSHSRTFNFTISNQHAIFPLNPRQWAYCPQRNSPHLPQYHPHPHHFPYLSSHNILSPHQYHRASSTRHSTKPTHSPSFAKKRASANTMSHYPFSSSSPSPLCYSTSSSCVTVQTSPLYSHHCRRCAASPPKSTNRSSTAAKILVEQQMHILE